MSQPLKGTSTTFIQHLFLGHKVNERVNRVRFPDLQTLSGIIFLGYLQTLPRYPENIRKTEGALLSWPQMQSPCLGTHVSVSTLRQRPK